MSCGVGALCAPSPAREDALGLESLARFFFLPFLLGFFEVREDEEDDDDELKMTTLQVASSEMDPGPDDCLLKMAEMWSLISEKLA